MTESFFTTLKTAAESVGVSVTDNQCEKLYKFYETVVEYNKNVNLTAITDEKEFIVKHIVDSILLRIPDVLSERNGWRMEKTCW